jgi:hypothetical protein
VRSLRFVQKIVGVDLSWWGSSQINVLFDSGFRGGAGRGGSKNLATKSSTACRFGRREILVPRLAYFRTPIGGGFDYDGSFVCSFHIVFISSLSM